MIYFGATLAIANLTDCCQKIYRAFMYLTKALLL